MNFLAFDLGASSGKMYLASLKDERISLEEIFRIPNHPIEVNGCLYWDFLRLYEGVNEGIRKAVALTGDDIESMGFDSFCNDFGFIDKSGALLSPVRCYRDERTARHQDKLDAVMGPEELYMVNGNQRGLFNTLPQLVAMKAEGQEWLLKNSDKALFVSDLFIYCLTGKKITEYTTASVTQMIDYDKADWSETVLKKYGISRELFAPITMPATVVGKTKEEINRKLGTKGFLVTSVCQHDTASAFLASVSDGEHMTISSGTWSVIGCETSGAIINELGYRFNIANEGSYKGHHRILRNVMGTWILQEMLREESLKGNEISFADIDKMAEDFPEPECVVDVDEPQFYNPGGMLEKVNEYWLKHVGRKPSRLGECVSSIYTGLVFKYRFTIEKLKELTGKEPSCINIVGGGAKSAYICRKIADICGLPVEAGPFDATAYGNILIQMIAKGAVSSVEEGRKLIRNSCEMRTYEPSPSADWDGKYKSFIDEIEGGEG